MKGTPLDNTKNALLSSLSQLNAQDTFNIIAFNGALYLFSSSMESATEEAILNATKWVDTNFIANGDTNIMLPITQVILVLHFQWHVKNIVFFFQVLLIKTFQLSLFCHICCTHESITSKKRRCNLRLLYYYLFSSFIYASICWND